MTYDDSHLEVDTEAVLSKLLEEIRAVDSEYTRNGRAYNSMHEVYGVLMEEVEEFWDEVKLKKSKRDPKRLMSELIQIASVAIRAARQINSGDSGNP